LDQQLKICNLLFDDRYGGPQKTAIDVAKVLSGEGVETLLCLPTGSGNAADIAGKEGIQVRRIPFQRIPHPRRILRFFRWIGLLPHDVWLFVRLFRHEKPDVVLLHGSLFLAPALAACLTRRPLIWRLEDTVVPRPFATVLGWIISLLAQRVIVVADAVGKHYGIARTSYEIVYPPAANQLFNVRSSRLQDTATYRIGTIANWNPLKGLEYLVQAMAQVCQQTKMEVELILAGAKLSSHSSYALSIEILIEQLGLKRNVRHLGFINSPVQVLKHVDIFVLSSISEGAPNVIAEAMAAGVPVVASDVGGIRELLFADPDQPAGVVVPPRDPSSLAHAILRLLENSDLALSLAKNGRRVARNNFTLDQCARKHLKIYRVLSGKSTPREPSCSDNNTKANRLAKGKSA
jgi:glycosyltransferase involved in cell wall biosynthesis